METLVLSVVIGSFIWATIRLIRLWRRKKPRNSSDYDSSNPYEDSSSPDTGGLFDGLFAFFGGGDSHHHDGHSHDHGDTDFGDCDGGDD